MTPDTTVWFFVGLGVTFGALGLYVATLWGRFRSLKRDEETLREGM